MTTIRQLLFFLFSLFLIVSCVEDKEENIYSDEPYEKGDKIQFQIGFIPTSRVSTRVDFKCDWEEGDEIGIFAVSFGTQLLDKKNPIHNKKLTYRNGKWEGEVYWHSAYLNDFYAYFPYNDNNGNPEGLDPTDIMFTVSDNQNSITTLNGEVKSNYSLSDFMIALSTNITKGSTVYLNFSHIMSMIQLKLDNQKNNIVTNNIHAILVGCSDTASIDLNITGIKATAGSGYSQINMYRLEQPGDTDYSTNFTFRAIIPKQTISAEHSLFLIYNGGRWSRSEALSSPLMLEEGKAELFGLIP